MVVEALVLCGYGINCEREMALGFTRAGARATVVHLADLEAGALDLHDFHVLALPGGFSFGDHLGSGRALAARLRHGRLWHELQRFMAEGKYVFGVCNGFQAMVKLGLFGEGLTLAANGSGRFENRWVRLAVEPASPCVYTRGLHGLELPSRHGEGRLVGAVAEGSVVLRYADAGGKPTEAYPANPNGSPGGIAGLCDPSGRIFGLMPHPEAFLDFTLHPRWTREAELLRRKGLPVPAQGQGLALFTNLVADARANLSRGYAETALR